jgi:hypothetical protein
MSSNPTQGMDVWCVCAFSVFVLSCVQVEALRRADHPSKESYRLWIIKKLRNQPYAPKVGASSQIGGKRKKKKYIESAYRSANLSVLKMLGYNNL